MAGFVQKIKDMWNQPDDEYDYEVDDGGEYAEAAEQEDRAEAREREREREREPEREYSLRKNTASVSQSVNNNKVVNIHATAQLQVVIAKPEHFGEETRTVAEELLKMHTVVLNLETTDKAVSRRIIDFLSGVAFANGGKIKKIATNTFIITPYNVDLTGEDVMDELESSGVYL